MDDGQGANPEWSENEGAISAALTRPWDDTLPFRRDDFVKLVSSCLKGLGYRNASKALEEESGHKAEPDDCTDRLLFCVSNGRWEEALDLLSLVQFSKPYLQTRARALLLRHRFVDLVEDRNLDEALACLREDLAPLFKGPQGDRTGGDDADSGFPQPGQLHALSTLLLAPTAASVRRLSAGGKSASRSATRTNAAVILRDLLVAGGRAIPHGRLETLLAQALTLQKSKCAYHNTSDIKLDLTVDHDCGLKMLPQVSTHILDDHEDEVWCCRFSNGGGMLATSSADGVLILWNVGDGGGGGPGGQRQGQSSVSLHRRIQVRDSVPQAIAWSPDDRWVLTCGCSSEVTRWDVGSGSEAMCYRGEHTEDVTEVAWLRDGRGFVSAGLDRKLVVWSLGGIVLAFWDCSTRITGIVVTLPARPPSHRQPPSPLYEDASGTAAPASTAGISNDQHWPLEAAGAAASRAGVNYGDIRYLGRGRADRHAPPPPPPPPPPQPPQPSQGRDGGSSNKDKQRQERQRQRREHASRNLRRCRVWAICGQDTIQAFDIEVSDYGEPPPPPPPVPAARHGHVVNGAGGRASQNGSSSSRNEEMDAKVEETREGDGEDARRLNGGGLGRGGGGGESPRFTPRRKSGGSCLLTKGEHASFDGDIIIGVSSPRDGSQLLLLHMDRARIWCWDPKTQKILKKYTGHHQNRYIVHSTFGGLDDSFVASGSEDSMVYLWHRRRGELIGSLDGHAGTVNSVDWNPSRPGMLASVCDDQTVRIWEPPLPEPQYAPLSPLPHDGGNASTAACSAAGGGGISTGSLSGSCGGDGSRKEVGGRLGSGGGDGLGPPSPGSRSSSDQTQRNMGRGGSAGRVKVKTEVKTELGATEAGRQGGRAGWSKGKGKGGRRVGFKGVKVEGGRGGGRWGYGLAQAPSATTAQGWEVKGGGEGCHDSGYSARIAALRW